MRIAPARAGRDELGRAGVAQSPKSKNGPTVCDGVRGSAHAFSSGVAPLPPSTTSKR